MANESLVFNGINAETGEYLIAPMSPTDLSNAIRGTGVDDTPAPVREQLKSELTWRREQATDPTFAPEEGVDPKDLAQTGWGVIFAAGADSTVRDALAELLDHRKEQAGDLYREFTQADGYRPGESKSEFLARHGAAPGWVNPKKMPYYLLLVGSPEQIPYQFQYQLDVQHAVGRLWFDSLAEYSQYARSVVTVEQGSARSPSATFFGVRNPGDGATELSATELVAPLAEHVAADQPTWQVRTLLEAETTKSRLLPMLGGNETPALLFTASHGMGFSAKHPLQPKHQGALLCQDWPGPQQHRGAIPPDFYLSADDIGDDASLLGLLTFHFACFGAGTPKLDDFAMGAGQERKTLAPEAFLSRLPQRLLGHPRGGALATIGHVERAWGCSFRSGDVQQLSAFQSMFKRLMEGHPVGSAMEPFGGYYAEVATGLTDEMETAKWTKEAEIDHLKITGLWIKHNDARGYAIIGDPAVRLNVSNQATPEAEKLTIEPVAPMATTPPVVPIEAKPIVATPTDEPPVATGAPLMIRVDVDDRSQTTLGAEVDFGLGDRAADLASALADMVSSVGRAIQSAFTDATSLRVVTYTSDDLETVTLDKESGRFTGSARLRAVTRLSLDGDTLLCLPEQEGEVDDRIWAIHSEAVTNAQTYRADLLKAVLSAAAGMIPTAK